MESSAIFLPLILTPSPLPPFPKPRTPGRQGIYIYISPFCSFGRQGSVRHSHLLVAPRVEASGKFCEVRFLCVVPLPAWTSRVNKQNRLSAGTQLVLSVSALPWPQVSLGTGSPVRAQPFPDSRATADFSWACRAQEDTCSLRSTHGGKCPLLLHQGYSCPGLLEEKN